MESLTQIVPSLPNAIHVPITTNGAPRSICQRIADFAFRFFHSLQQMYTSYKARALVLNEQLGEMLPGWLFDLIALLAFANLNLKGYEGVTPLMRSCGCKNKPHLTQTMIQLGADVHQESTSGRTALHIAAGCGNSAAVQALCMAGADVNKQSEEGETPLIAACLYGDIECTRILLLAGANINYKYSHVNGHSPLSIAVSKDNVELVRLLLLSGAIVDNILNDGFTPLVTACLHEQIECVRVLLEAKANANLPCQIEGGLLPLSIAVQRNNFELACLLTKFGAIVDTINDKGFTPLISACLHEQIECARVLLEAGANANLPTQNGLPPLSIAVQHNNFELARLLMEFGANPHQVTKRGHTPFQSANHRLKQQLLHLPAFFQHLAVNTCSIIHLYSILSACTSPLSTAEQKVAVTSLFHKEALTELRLVLVMCILHDIGCDIAPFWAQLDIHKIRGAAKMLGKSNSDLFFHQLLDFKDEAQRNRVYPLIFNTCSVSFLLKWCLSNKPLTNKAFSSLIEKDLKIVVKEINAIYENLPMNERDELLLKFFMMLPPTKQNELLQIKAFEALANHLFITHRENYEFLSKFLEAFEYKKEYLFQLSTANLTSLIESWHKNGSLHSILFKFNEIGDNYFSTKHHLYHLDNKNAVLAITDHILRGVEIQQKVSSLTQESLVNDKSKTRLLQVFLEIKKNSLEELSLAAACMKNACNAYIRKTLEKQGDSYQSALRAFNLFNIFIVHYYPAKQTQILFYKLRERNLLTCFEALFLYKHGYRSKPIETGLKLLTLYGKGSLASREALFPKESNTASPILT